MRSFRFKILALAILLVGVCQVATIVAVLVTASRDVERRARDELAIGGVLVDEFLYSRGTQLATTVRVLAADFGFKEAVGTLDVETIRSALANHRQRARAELAVLLDLDGQVIATDPGDPGEALTTALPSLLAHAPEAAPAVGILTAEGMAFQTVTVPLRAPLPVAWVSMGFRIDDELAARIAGLTGLEVTFLSEDHREIRLVGSSLPPAVRPELELALAQLPPPLGQTFAFGPAADEFLGMRRPFTSGSGAVTALLQMSVREAMAPYRELRLTILALGGLALLAALLGAVLLSRAVMRPVRGLVGAARRIKLGDYAEPVVVQTKDELGELALAFNAMQQGIAEREQRIIHQARHDRLTRLPNRLLGVERLQEALHRAAASAEPVSVMLLKLDRFEDVTSSLGHEIGDEILRQTAQRLQAGIGDPHLLARLEGAEFLIVWEGLAAETARAAALQLLRLLHAGIAIDEAEVSLEASIGLCAYPEHGADADQLLRRAAIARSDAIGETEPVRIYQRGRQERYVRQLAIMGDLRRAVAEDQLSLVFQPKLRLSDARVSGAEALVRWQHPRLGAIPPTDFIPIAEQSGNISLVTRWVLREAVRACRRWREIGQSLDVSVNLSAEDLRDDNLPYFILELLREQALDPSRLTLEITENAFVRDISHAILLLDCLRDLGVKVAIDDFGIGYSSLAQIKRLPVDSLKIDRSFMRSLPQDAADAAIVHSTIGLAHDLGLEAVAEGVETAPALEWLRRQGCEQVQGFHISPPLAAADLIIWLQPGEARLVSAGP